MNRITVSLTKDERTALQVLSDRERRNPRDQAALLIRSALERIGLLLSDNQPTHQEAKHELQTN